MEFHVRVLISAQTLISEKQEQGIIKWDPSLGDCEGIGLGW